MAKKQIITGHRELDATLAAMPLTMQKAIARRSLKKAADSIAYKAGANLHNQDSVETGELVGGIKKKAFKRSRTRIGVFVTTSPRKGGDDEAFGGAQLELGTKHQRAKPFLRPAGYDSAPLIEKAIIADIEATIRVIAAKNITTTKGLTAAFK